jgi:hypothetical protein
MSGKRKRAGPFGSARCLCFHDGQAGMPVYRFFQVVERVHSGIHTAIKFFYGIVHVGFPASSNTLNPAVSPFIIMPDRSVPAVS